MVDVRPQELKLFLEKLEKHMAEKFNAIKTSKWKRTGNDNRDGDYEIAVFVSLDQTKLTKYLVVCDGIESGIFTQTHAGLTIDELP